MSILALTGSGSMHLYFKAIKEQIHLIFRVVPLVQFTFACGEGVHFMRGNKITSAVPMAAPPTLKKTDCIGRGRAWSTAPPALKMAAHLFSTPQAVGVGRGSGAYSRVRAGPAGKDRHARYGGNLWEEARSTGIFFFLLFSLKNPFPALCTVPGGSDRVAALFTRRSAFPQPFLEQRRRLVPLHSALARPKILAFVLRSFQIRSNWKACDVKWGFNMWLIGDVAEDRDFGGARQTRRGPVCIAESARLAVRATAIARTNRLGVFRTSGHPTSMGCGSWWAGFGGGGGVRGGTGASWSHHTAACVVQSVGVAESTAMAWPLFNALCAHGGEDAQQSHGSGSSYDQISKGHLSSQSFARARITEALSRLLGSCVRKDMKASGTLLKNRWETEVDAPGRKLDGNTMAGSSWGPVSSVWLRETNWARGVGIHVRTHKAFPSGLWAQPGVSNPGAAGIGISQSPREDADNEPSPRLNALVVCFTRALEECVEGLIASTSNPADLT
ncbi:hypothetical protein C8R47DRAFT_1077725 [Mycena vitilis]|nr:hypothetical protein C8R47DRAFT_1077725 [Mycena vitilis]